MPLANLKLFDPITRIENAARRESEYYWPRVILLPPKDNELVLREIQEIKDASTLFEFYLEAGALPGSQDSIRSHGGT